ncbi:MAG: ATP-grasp domain-containing protein [Acidimicrobiia bacterium]
MTRIVVILPSSTYRAGEFVSASAELGVELIVASEGEPPIDMGDRYLQIDCSDVDAAAARIVAFGDTAPIDGIVAADDVGVVVAAVAGQKLGLPSNDPDAARATRDKAIMRRRLESGEVPQPRWATLDPSDDAGIVAGSIGYPLVIKPLALSAGQGVIRVDRPEELTDSADRARAIIRSTGQADETLILESFMEGTEVAVEGLVASGNLTPLAIFDKPAESVGKGFEETILITPSRHEPSVQAEIFRVAGQAVKSLGLAQGPVHIELMVSGEKVRVIEVAGRSIGGLCSRSLSFGLMGTSLESLILRNAIGRDKPELRRSPDASGVLMVPIPAGGSLAGFEGIDEVRGQDAITGVEITARPGDAVAPPPEGGRYIGFVFAEAKTPEIVELALIKAMSTIEVIIE